MSVKKKKWLELLMCFMLYAAIPSLGIHAVEAYEFVNRDIHEILYALSLYTGLSISADDTVSGTADFRCTGSDFSDSFDAFLLQSRLYVEKTENRWTVSRVRIQRNNELYALDAFDVTPMQLFEKFTIAAGVCVTYESLPAVKVSLHTGFCSLEEILRRIADLCMGFSLEKTNDNTFHVARETLSSKQNPLSGKVLISRIGELWYADISNAPFSMAAEKLFGQAGKEYCFSLSNDLKINRACFKAGNFEDMLSLLCMQSGVEFTVQEGIYFLLPARNKQSLARRGKIWNKYGLQFLKNTECISILAKRFPELECILLPDSMSLLFLCEPEKADEVRNFIEEIDSKNLSRLVRLKYIRTDEFLSHLPAFVEKGSVFDTGHGDSFFFVGSDSAYKRLLDEVSVLDKPVPRVRYDLLIMQYQSTKGSEWNPRFKAGRVKLGDMNDAAVQLGSVLNLNLDVVGAFGLHFAGELQAAISESRAKVFADTTLNGVSGKSIHFQNTNTYRYRDNNLDPETGEPIYSGVTKEIISGLKLEVTGTVTGDGMISTKITASVSRQGTDLSTTTGNPPPTSEKVVTTEVRAKSGEPVVLSGLVQEEENNVVSRIPFVSRIPLLGRLFRSEDKSVEKNELVIYLLPTADIHEENVDSASESDLKNLLYEAAESYIRKSGKREV
ncbi:MAG: type II and III secretion system protein [Treponema sp.]|uniref:type II secretion system protein GspD n=1 Tax=Treponema sp. TaxID=166 RepID=UPI0025DB88B0|nr:type II and III secretion system protein [Treponema sp.]MBQ9281651.1 type II and III secretion system protein [Treponema sp.]